MIIFEHNQAKFFAAFVVLWVASFSILASESQALGSNQNLESADEHSQPKSAADWLMFMQKSMVERNYKGTFMFSRGAMSTSMSIVHRYENGIESERLKQLDGEMGEIVRSGERVMCVFPDNRVVEVESSPLSQNFANKLVGFMPGESQYELTLKGVERMVDQACTVIEINANDNDRYSYRLWVDSQKGLLLKSVILGLEGEPLEKFQYTQIEYLDSVDPKYFDVDKEPTLVHHEMIPAVAKGTEWPEEMMWTITWIPKGYMKLNGKVKAGDNVMVYSDGLSTFSVFVETPKNDMMPEGASQVGATTAYSMENEMMGQKYHVTVVGEIPAMTAMKIAKSVKPSM